MKCRICGVHDRVVPSKPDAKKSVCPPHRKEWREALKAPKLIYFDNNPEPMNAAEVMLALEAMNAGI